VMILMMAIEEAPAERLCVRDAAEPLRMSVKKLLAYFASGMLQLRRPRHGRPVFAWGHNRWRFVASMVNSR
jgi:hypothetical protein